MQHQELSTLDKVLNWVGRSQFFSYSLLIHLVLIFTLGTAALFTAQVEDQGFTAPPGDGGFVEPRGETAPVEAQPLQQQTQQQVTQATEVIRPSSVSQTADAIMTNSQLGSQTALALNQSVFTRTSNTNLVMPETPGEVVSSANITVSTNRLSAGSAQGIADFTKGWRTGGGRDGKVSGSGRFKFKAYLAKYKLGDWDSAHTIRNNRIAKGALTNLCLKMTDWSNERVEAEAILEPLDLASSEIFEVKPPFIFFTGTKDFVLTDKEIENLRQYLLVGGAIWGDSSLPGRNSRFDVAFRREMKRVVSDKDKEFEPLPTNSDLFTMEHRFNNVPPGLNYYQEPVYVIRVYGVPSVFYTPNDYGNMMEIGLTEDDEIDMSRNAENDLLYTRWDLWWNREVFFRNLETDSIKLAYEFSSNMVFYLLTRWEMKLRSFNPRGY